MSVPVKMPQLGESVTEGTVTRWLKREGDHVFADEPLLEVSTDKVDTEIPSPISGILRGITVAEDETVAVGAELAIIDEDSPGGANGASAAAAPAGVGADGTATSGTVADGTTSNRTGTDRITPDGITGRHATTRTYPEPTPYPEPAPRDPAQHEPAPPFAEAAPYAQTSQYAEPATSYGEPVTYTEPVAPHIEPRTYAEPVAPYTEPATPNETTAEFAAPAHEAAPPYAEPASYVPRHPAEAEPALTPYPGLAQHQAQPSAYAEPAPSPAQQAPATSEEAVASPYVTPLVRKLAAEHGIDLATIAGTGVGGRIRKQDVLEAASSQRAEQATVPAPATPALAGATAVAAPAAFAPSALPARPATAAFAPSALPARPATAAFAPSASPARPATAEDRAPEPAPVPPPAPPAPAAQPAQPTPASQPAPPARAVAEQPSFTPEASLRGTTERLSRARQVIAQRMVESLQTSAQLTTVVEADVTAIARLREQTKAAFDAREGVKLSFLPFFALAAVEALKVHPKLNAVLDTANGTVTYHDAEHLGIAVDTDRGLMVPVIRNAGDLNIGGLARKIADLAQRTRAGHVGPDDLTGGTFTLTNTGSRGALFDTPIINQPQVGILGTGTVNRRAVVVEDPHLGEVITVRSVVYLALTYDHRLVDGADAARFLVTIKNRLEQGAFEAELGR
jgi:pyruvate dehydrogenase E2 component (dihydrolipoyllysine-residue acetyltransferase)